MVVKQQDYYLKRNHVPAFGSWDCNEDLPFTQCFETARQQAGLLRYSYSDQDRDLYVAGDLYENDVVTPAMIVVPRRKVPSCPRPSYYLHTPGSDYFYRSSSSTLFLSFIFWARGCEWKVSGNIIYPHAGITLVENLIVRYIWYICISRIVNQLRYWCWLKKAGEIKLPRSEKWCKRGRGRLGGVWLRLWRQTTTQPSSTISST